MHKIILSHLWKWLRRIMKVIGYSILAFIVWLVLIFSSKTMGEWLFAYPLVFINQNYVKIEKWWLGQEAYNYKHYYKPIEFTIQGKVFDIPKGHVALGTLDFFYEMYPTGETPNSISLVAKLPKLAKDLEHTRYWNPKDRTQNVVFSIVVNDPKRSEEEKIEPYWKLISASYGLQEHLMDEEWRKHSRRYYGKTTSQTLNRLTCAIEPTRRQVCFGAFLLIPEIGITYEFHTKHLPDWQNIAEQLEALTLSFYNEEKTKKLQESLTQPKKGN